MKILTILNMAILISIPAFASDLDSKLDALNIPDDRVTPLLSQENLISVTGRYSSLNKRHAFTLKGANNFLSDSHIDSKQLGSSYRFHINSKWSIGGSYNEYENVLSSAGKKLFDDEKVLPDTDYAIKSADVFINYNTMYGKLRLTDKKIIYFDHYIALGYGHIDLASGESVLYNVDTGLSFWLGKKASFRIGAKNEFYRQRKLTESKNAQNAMGYLEVGYLL